MNSKQLVILIVAVVVVVGLGWMLKSKEQSSWQSKPEGVAEKVLPDFPLNDVSKLKIETKDKTLNLSKETGWVVVERDNYPANSDQIATLLRTFWDLKPVQTVEAGESQYPRLEVAPPKAEKGGGTLISFSKGDQAIASLILGKNHQSSEEGASFPNGRFILAPDKKKIYVVANTLGEAQPDAVQWLNREFVQAGKAKSIQVVGKEGSSWTLIKDSEGSEWKFADAKEKEKVDAEKSGSAGGAFSSFADVAGKREKLKDALADPKQVKVTTFDGFVYDFAIGSEKEGNRHVTVDVSADLPAQRTAPADEKPEDKTRLDEEFKTNQEGLKKRLEKEKKYSEWVYLIPSSSLDLFFKTRADLIAPEPTPEPQTSAPAPTSPMPVVPPGPPVPVPTQAAPANP